MQVGNFRQTIPMIHEEFDQFIISIDEIGDEIIRQEKVVQKVLEELALVDIEDSNEETDKMILSRYTQAKETIKNKTDEINSYSSRIDKWQQTLERINRELSKKQDNSDVQKAEAFHQEMIKLEKLFNETKERIFNEIVEHLQKESNVMYRDLTARNQTMGGTLKFQKREDGTLKVMVINENGDELTGNGTGFQRMKQLAIVMSIISLYIKK